MSAQPFAKPVRLELQHPGRKSWLFLGRFDAADDEQTALVLDAAEQLVQTLNNGGPVERCPILRVCRDELHDEDLVHWTLDHGWRDVLTGRQV